ncbi:ABC transporter permease subunit [Pseudoflavonifractor sp. An85]|uniref:ABC transporter permease n=1 Tax=Pseudoflavonifractor sp. An85 TaxID=1965661 RepID=UPI000B37FF85|nr:ABC transporter permease subunit [Pseudoflavonifractor sp. An85]OUN20953.1 ABC transporter permease [Pseudoflavonifractor sp. An85]
MTASTMCPNWSKKLLRIAIPLAVWLGVWQLASFWVGRELLLPSPYAVAQCLGQLSCTPEFWLSAGYTLLRVVSGLVGGVVLGTVLAFLTRFCIWADWVFSPAIRVLRATPVVSFILLVYLWVSRANIPGLIAGMMVLPVVWGSLTAGLKAVDGQLLEMARAYGFSSFKTLRLIYLPSLRPHFTGAILNGFGLAWKSGVAAEVLCPPKWAIGSSIQQARQALETPELFAWTLVIVALSLVLEGLLGLWLKPRGEGNA